MSPENASAGLATRRLRETNKDDPRLASAPSPVKSDAVLDFLQRPTFARFLRAFQRICFNDQANRNGTGQNPRLEVKL